MAVYEYRGIFIASGKAAKGVRDADNLKALRAVLRKEGILLSSAQEDSVKQASKKAREIDVFAFFKKAGTGDVAVMTRQLATLVRAGLPLNECLHTVALQTENLYLREVIQQVRRDILSGSSFTEAVARHPAASGGWSLVRITAGSTRVARSAG